VCWRLQLQVTADADNTANLNSQSDYLSAMSAYTSAKEAAEYAGGKYDTYKSAAETSQAQVDASIPALTAEKGELAQQKPEVAKILDMLAPLLGAASAQSAKGQPQLLQELPGIKKLAGEIFAPRARADKRMGKHVKALDMLLVSTDTEDTGKKMKMVIDTILAQMDTRMGEIDRAVAKLNGDLVENQKKRVEWQETLVQMSEKRDRAEQEYRSASNALTPLLFSHT